MSDRYTTKAARLVVLPVKGCPVPNPKRFFDRVFAEQEANSIIQSFLSSIDPTKQPAPLGEEGDLITITRDGIFTGTTEETIKRFYDRPGSGQKPTPTQEKKP